MKRVLMTAGLLALVIAAYVAGTMTGPSTARAQDDRLNGAQVAGFERTEDGWVYVMLTNGEYYVRRESGSGFNGAPAAVSLGQFFGPGAPVSSDSKNNHSLRP